MNRIYRLVFSALVGDVVAAGENARRRAPRYGGAAAILDSGSVTRCFALFGMLLMALLIFALLMQHASPAAVALGTIGTGVAKQVRYKAQPTYATLPGTGSAQILRRVTSDLNKKKGTFGSNELLSSYQRRDYRHGVSSVAGSIAGELSPGTWKDFFGAALRRDPTAVSAIAGASITVAGAGPTFTVTRAAGSFLTDGVKAGMVVRLTAGSFNAANLNKNLVVLSLTATVLTVMPLNGVALVAEGPIAASTVSIPGKVNYVPQTGQLDKMFTFEHWFSDVAQSELFDSCKVDELAVTIGPNGMATISVKLLGRDMLPATAAYYVSPTAETTAGLLAGPQGILIAQGAAVANLTGLSFSIKGNMTGEQVVGSTTYADITEGSVLVDGQVTALFDSASLRDLFLNETEAALVAVLGTSQAAAAEFLACSLPRVKFGGADKDDGNKSIVQTLPFSALENVAGGTGTSSEATTFWVQDSLA